MAPVFMPIPSSQRETNFSEYLNTLYSDSSTAMLEDMVTEGLAESPLSTEDYETATLIWISCGRRQDRICFSCDAKFVSLCLAAIIPLSRSKLN